LATMRPQESDAPGDLQDRRDKHLIERVATGDDDAFGELFARYGPVALGLASRIIADTGYAEEVIQEVFVGVWRRAGTYDATRGSVRTWLLTQVHHRAVDIVRREEAARRRSTVVLDPTDEPPGPEDVVDESWIQMRRSQVRAALGALPNEQRRVIELAYYGGLSQSQVAEQIGAPLGTVKSRTITGLRRLRDALNAQGER